VAVIRGHHAFDDHYTQIPNDWVRDSDISLKSIGLLAQIMSHTPGWNMSIRSLAKANKCSADAVRTAVKELEDKGYLVRSEQKHDQGGRFADFDFTTKDPKVLGKPVTVKTRNGETQHKEEQEPKEQQLKENSESVFDIFWVEYPKKTDKGAARKAFTTALKKTDLETLIQSAKEYAQSTAQTEIKFIKNPATWLNAEAWANEVPKGGSSIWDQPTI
jgi:DNA-binding Lrp family transcriptional regulator